MVSFFLDPFTYVLFKKNFKRKLRRSITELAEFLSDVGLTKKVKRQTSRAETGERTDMGSTSGLGLGQFGRTTVIEAYEAHTDKNRNPVCTLKS